MSTTVTPESRTTTDPNGAVHSNAHPDVQFGAEFLAKIEAEGATDTAVRSTPAKDAGGASDTTGGAAATPTTGDSKQDAADEGTDLEQGGEHPNADDTEHPDATGADSGTDATDSTATDGTAQDAAFDEAFSTAMAKHGATIELKDLPAEVRPVVERKVKAMEAGFTRAMQEVRAEQKAGLADKAELRFQREQPAQFIAAQLLANPEIADQVNTLLGEMEGSETARKYHTVVIENERAKARSAVEQDATEAVRQSERAFEVERLGRAAAEAAGLPDALWAGLEAAIALHVTQHGDIETAEIQQLAKKHAEPYRKLIESQKRESARNASARYVQAKVNDQRTAGLRVKPGAGHSPGPAAKPKPKNDDEFKADLISRLP